MGLKKAPISKLSIKTVHMNVHWKNHERFERFERLNVNVNVNVQGTPLRGSAGVILIFQRFITTHQISCVSQHNTFFPKIGLFYHKYHSFSKK